jgi:hypothetical protein
MYGELPHGVFVQMDAIGKRIARVNERDIGAFACQTLRGEQTGDIAYPHAKRGDTQCRPISLFWLITKCDQVVTSNDAAYPGFVTGLG